MNRLALCILALLALAGVVRAEVRLEQVATGLASPVFVTHAGDGSNRLYVLERAGVVRVIVPGETVGTVFLDVRSRVNASSAEQGLLGLAFHPGYATNGRFFVFYTDLDGATRVVGYRVSSNPNGPDAESANPLLTIPPPSRNPNAGRLGSGPDGFPYVAVGHGG